MLDIKGFEKVTLIDYPGKMASIVFLPHCNFRCPYCHNPGLIETPDAFPSIKEEEILSYLDSKRKWLDGVCITGGEPTLHKELPDFIRKLKKHGFAVKLDTNGTNPEMLEFLIREKLIDYIAMDIKGPLERYDEITKVSVNKENIKKSVELIRNSGIDYEFRITSPRKLIGKEDIKIIGEWLKGSKAFFIQRFRSGDTLEKGFKDENPYTEKELQELAETAKPYFEKVAVR